MQINVEDLTKEELIELTAKVIVAAGERGMEVVPEAITMAMEDDSTHCLEFIAWCTDVDLNVEG